MQPTTEYLAAKLDTIEDMLRQHISDSALWRQKTDTELAQNTAVTKQISAVATTGKTLRSALIWIGGAAAAVVGLLQLWQITQQIGPTP